MLMGSEAAYIDKIGNLEIEYLENVALIAKIRNDQKVIDKFNRSMTRVLNREWQIFADEAVKSGLAEFEGIRSTNQVARIVAAVEKKLEGFGKKSERVINTQIDLVYETLTLNFLKKFNLKVSKASLSPKAKVELSELDRDAVVAIKRLTNQTAGSLFPEQVIDKVALSVNDVIFEQGLPLQEAATRIEAEIASALGADSASSVVPARFKTNPADYFDTLANNASLLSNNVGSLIAMDDAGVEKYRIVIVFDKVTSNICLGMQDRVISVGSGMQMVNQLIGFNNPRELKAAFPWNSRRTGADLGPRTLENNNRIAESGLGFPPYHGKCRSIAVPVFD